MRIHVVQTGDTLWKIARQYGISFEDLKRLNAHLANPDYIVPGMEIILPDGAGATHQKDHMKGQPVRSHVKEQPKSTVKEQPKTMVKEHPVKKEQPIVKPPVKELPKPPMPMPVPQPILMPIEMNWTQPQPQPMHVDLFNMMQMPDVNVQQSQPIVMPQPIPVPQPEQPHITHVHVPQQEPQQITHYVHVPYPETQYVPVPVAVPHVVHQPCKCHEKQHHCMHCGRRHCGCKNRHPRHHHPHHHCGCGAFPMSMGMAETPLMGPPTNVLGAQTMPQQVGPTYPTMMPQGMSDCQCGMPHQGMPGYPGVMPQQVMPEYQGIMPQQVLPEYQGVMPQQHMPMIDERDEFAVAGWQFPESSSSSSSFNIPKGIGGGHRGTYTPPSMGGTWGAGTTQNPPYGGSPWMMPY